VIGAGSNSTFHMAGYVKRAKDLGADAALVVTPYYNKPNDSGIIKHFEKAAAAGLPVIIYNIASRTGRNIPTPLMEELARIPGIVGVKEASGDIIQMGDVIAKIAGPRKGTDNPFWVLSGDDSMTLPLAALGGDGIISVISNLLPKKVHELARACLDGRYEEARRIHYELLPFMKNAFIETNPVPVKAAMGWAGLPAGPVRLPLGPLSGANAEILRQSLADMGVLP
ncbi:MAG: 4-hydroxy-tetrahydrodipicolinate synthase, partial [Treponema sp.]|nr:4-hydroxy-tetrahydrodipicolinate synthase [Treponema sp.]